MVRVIFDDKFQRAISKIKNKSFREQVDKQIEKIIINPEVGKPMRHGRKGTREVYVSSFRLSYCYYQHKDFIEFLYFYHKDKQ